MEFLSWERFDFVLIVAFRKIKITKQFAGSFRITLETSL